MLKTFVITNAFNIVIQKAKSGIIGSGGKNKELLKEIKEFNELPDYIKHDLFFEMMDGQALFIKKQMANRETAGIVNLGRFVFVSAKEEFNKEINKELTELGASRLTDVSAFEKERIVKDSRAKVASFAIKNYFDKIAQRDIKPKVLNLNLSGKKGS